MKYEIIYFLIILSYSFYWEPQNFHPMKIRRRRRSGNNKISKVEPVLLEHVSLLLLLLFFTGRELTSIKLELTS